MKRVTVLTVVRATRLLWENGKYPRFRTWSCLADATCVQRFDRITAMEPFELHQMIGDRLLSDFGVPCDLMVTIRLQLSFRVNLALSFEWRVQFGTRAIYTYIRLVECRGRDFVLTQVTARPTLTFA